LLKQTATPLIIATNGKYKLQSESTWSESESSTIQVLMGRVRDQVLKIWTQVGLVYTVRLEYYIYIHAIHAYLLPTCLADSRINQLNPH